MTTLVKLNLACGDNPFGNGWVNIDKKRQFVNLRVRFRRANLLKGIPAEDCSVDVVYTSHFLEHLEPFDECRRFLDDCFRVLKPGGNIRIVVPDFRRIAEIYLKNPQGFYEEYGFDKPWFDKARGWSRRLGISVMFSHKMLYDNASLTEVLENSGFTSITHVQGSQRGLLAQAVASEINQKHLFHSLIMDAAKAKDVFGRSVSDQVALESSGRLSRTYARRTKRDENHTT